MSTDTEQKTVDWVAIELDYRAGLKSLRQLSAQYGINHVSIAKRAKRDEWERDLSAKIKAKATALVNSRTANSEANSSKVLAEKQVVEGTAKAIADVLMEQRSDIQSAKSMFRSMMAELEVLGTQKELLAGLIELTHEGPEGEDAEGAARRQARNRKLLEQVTSLAGRIDSGKRLVETLEKIVKMERDSYGITTAAEDKAGDGLNGLLASIGRSAMPVAQTVDPE